MSDQLLQMETTCGSLLYELQVIWDEVGETDAERDKMLLELEQECLEVYRRKVDQANRSRAQIRRAIADHEAELAAICSSMGERPVHLRQSEQNIGSLKEELKAIVPQLDEMRKKRRERLAQFAEVVEQIRKIVEDISESADSRSAMKNVDESDLSVRKLDELHKQLEALQKEKMDRLRQVLDLSNTLNSLCLVLGLDFMRTISEVHPSLNDSQGSKSISNKTLESLRSAILKLRENKVQRIQKLQDLATSLLELWNLMDTPLEEQQDFQKVTCKLAASEDEITEPGILSLEFLEYVEVEVVRLEELKSTKMKELVLKRRAELEEICRRTHLLVEEDTSLECALEAIDSGAIDPSCILERMELQVARVKEEAFSRKEILDKVEKWIVACEEESWLEEYNRDENRYNAGKGAHLTLKRAEKARALVNKLPAMVENLTSKVIAWEREIGIDFTYDGIRLLSMLEEYILLRQEKEEEKIRKREEKRLQGQLIAEQEARYGSKPSPMKTPNVKKNPRPSTGNANRRLSLGAGFMQTPKVDIHSAKGNQTAGKKRNAQLDTIPSTLSASRRGLDVDGLSAKKHPFNPSNIVEAETRKPFSPVSLKNSNGYEDVSNIGRESSLLRGTAGVHAVSSTPNKLLAGVDDENMTPKVMGVHMKTPSTISVPMQTAMTPANAPPVAALHFAGKDSEQVEEEIEYSFEEKRLAFIIGKENLRAVYA